MHQSKKINIKSVTPLHFILALRPLTEKQRNLENNFQLLKSNISYDQRNNGTFYSIHFYLEDGLTK